MSSCTPLFRVVLLVALLLVFFPPGVSAWTISNWSVAPSGAGLPPGTPVTAGYSIHFDSWMSGTTFDKDNALSMSTDLANPQWVVKKIETMDDQPPIVEQIPVRQGQIVKIDGWTLSYSRKRFDLSVQLAGKTPALNETKTIAIVKVQEVAPGSKPIASTLVRKEVQVLVPTPEPTVAPAEVTINMTPAEIIEITPDPTVADSAAPTRKVTYSPGPGPLSVMGVLCLLIVAMAARRRG